MARLHFVVLIFLVLAATFVSNTEGRKLLMSNITEENKKEISNDTVPSLLKNLILNALPKGTVPSSTPSKKGHATLDNEQRFRRHLARIERILQSVPSPGVGH